MKHIQTFENFTEEEREAYDKIASSKEELENSSSFSEMSEKEQEVLSDAYSKESESISDDIKEKIDTLTKSSTLNELFSEDIKTKQLEKVGEYCRLRGEIGNKLRELGFGFKVYQLNNESFSINKLEEKLHHMNANRDYDKIHELLAQYFKASFGERMSERKYNKL